MKVEDYVRTIKGFGKVEKIEILKKDTIIYLDSGITIDYITKDFTKDELNKMYPSSSNIIDLIEVGDIVNYGLLGGGMVIFKKDGEITTNTILFSNLKEKDIKKVITKEQIENLEYEVE